MPMMRPKKGTEFGIPDPPKPRDGEAEYEYRYLQYPKMLYRPLEEPDSQSGQPFTTLIVETAAAEQAALDEGWQVSPVSAAPKPTKKVKVPA